MDCFVYVPDLRYERVKYIRLDAEATMQYTFGFRNQILKMLLHLLLYQPGILSTKKFFDEDFLLEQDNLLLYL